MRLRFVILLGLAFAAACSPSRTHEADRAATPTASAGVLPVCSASEDACAGDDEAVQCNADARSSRRVRCAGETVCAAGRCVSLRAPAPGERVLERGALLEAGPDGWLNAWSAAPLLLKTPEQIGEVPARAFAADSALAFRPLCAESAYVTAIPKADARPPSPNRVLFTGYLVAGRAGPARFKVGVTGGFRLWLGGARVIDAMRAPTSARPFADEIEATVDLREGVNAVAIVAEQSAEPAVGFWLRVRDMANRPIPDLRFMPAAPGVVCTPSDLLHLEATPHPVRGGFDVAVDARFPGLSPRGPSLWSYVAALIKDAGKSADGLPGGSLGLTAMRAGTATFSLPVSFPASGKFDLELTLGEGAGAIARKVSLAYGGAAHDRVVALEEAVAKIEVSSAPEASRESFASQVGMLAEALATNVSDLGWIAEQATELEGLAPALLRGEDPYRTKTGVVHRAYRSRLDGHLQPYVLFVPRSYRPGGRPLPLVLAFHGLNRLPEHALRTVIGEAPDDDTTLAFAARHLPAFPDQGAILAAPFGYGTAGARPLGEDDVLRVVEEVRAHYDVDPRRVSLTGYSLGGTVAFVVPLHSPDVFSAAAPLCGYPNLATYDNVRSRPHTPWEDALIAKRFIVNYCENGLHLPLHIVHGGLDGPARSEVVASRYEALGYSRIFDVQDDLDHNVWDYAYEDGRMIEWLTAQRRPSTPAHVRFVTGEYRYDRAYWVRLIAMQDSRAPAIGGTPPGFSDIDAHWMKDKREVTVATKNVSAFALDLGALGAIARVVVDGTAMAMDDASPTVFFERNAAGAWTRAAAEPSRAGKKRHGVAGPLDDVLRHPQLIVYGTQDPAQTEANRRVAEHFSSSGYFAYAHFPMKADTETTDADLTGKSLVLIGNPASNTVTAKLIDGLPVRFEGGAVVLGGARYAGENVGVSLIYPHPRDPAEYVVLHAGVGYRGTLESRNLPELAPDYLVYDERITVQRGEVLLDKREVLAGGFFDDDWRVSK